MSIDDVVALLPEDKREEAAKMLKDMHNDQIKGAIMRVITRNMSHGVSKAFLLSAEKTKKS